MTGCSGSGGAIGCAFLGRGLGFGFGWAVGVGSALGAALGGRFRFGASTISTSKSSCMQTEFAGGSVGDSTDSITVSKTDSLEAASSDSSTIGTSAIIFLTHVFHRYSRMANTRLKDHDAPSKLMGLE